MHVAIRHESPTDEKKQMECLRPRRRNAVPLPLDEVPSPSNDECNDACAVDESQRNQEALELDLSNVEELLIESPRSRVEKLLKESPFFQELSQTVQDKLPSIVHQTSEKAGAVLFQQGDAPGDCYILLSGTVGVWKKEYEPEQVISSNSSSTSTTCPSIADSISSADIHHRGSDRRRSSSDACRPSSSDSLPEKERRKGGIGLGFDREQFYALAFGNQVTTLGHGAIFGELALMRNQPRSATITCVENCELFVIKRADFDAVMKVEMNKINIWKCKFLMEYLPGMKSLTPPRVAKSLYLFNKVTVPRGHKFLTQGITSKKCVSVLTRGMVSLSRREGKFNDGPSRQLGELLRGSVFGSCVARTPEPFSVVATSECEILHCDSQNMDEMPFGISLAIRDHLAFMMLRRVEQCSADRMGDVVLSPSSSSSCSPSPLARRASCSRGFKRNSQATAACLSLSRASPSLLSPSKPSRSATPSCLSSNRQHKRNGSHLGLMGMLHLRPSSSGKDQESLASKTLSPASAKGSWGCLESLDCGRPSTSTGKAVERQSWGESSRPSTSYGNAFAAVTSSVTSPLSRKSASTPALSGSRACV